MSIEEIGRCYHNNKFLTVKVDVHLQYMQMYKQRHMQRSHILSDKMRNGRNEDNILSKYAKFIIQKENLAIQNNVTL